MINESEGLFEIQSETTKQHHEFSPLFQRDFYNYVQKLKQNIIVSLFEHNELSEVINIDVVFDDHFCHNIQLLKAVGSAEQQTADVQSCHQWNNLSEPFWVARWWLRWETSKFSCW